MKPLNIAALARCRAQAGLSEADCLVWFGAGRATIERVEAGEIEPGEELAERIERFVTVIGAPLGAERGPDCKLTGPTGGGGDQLRVPAAAFEGGAR